MPPPAPPGPRAEPGALTQAGRQRLLVGPHGPLDLPHFGGRRGGLRWDTEPRAPAASQPRVPAPPRPLVPGAAPPRPAEPPRVPSSGPAPRRQAGGAGSQSVGTQEAARRLQACRSEGPSPHLLQRPGPTAGRTHLDACVVLGVCSASSAAVNLERPNRCPGEGALEPASLGSVTPKC